MITLALNIALMGVLLLQGVNCGLGLSGPDRPAATASARASPG